MQKENSSWDPYSKWYDAIVGEKGHFFHREVILPALKKLFQFDDTPSPSLIDLGCGQGFLAGEIPDKVRYVGVDIGKDLLSIASQHHKRAEFYERDLAKPLDIPEKPFTHGIFLLSLQNIPDLKTAIESGSRYLAPGGRLFLVLNHPCFRIPRQSSIEIDEKNQLQYRRINLYHTSLSIPIQMHPGKQSTALSYSFHHPLEDYFRALKSGSLVVEELEELYSTKLSTGKHAKMENRARNEFPYFMIIVAKKS